LNAGDDMPAAELSVFAAVLAAVPAADAATFEAPNEKEALAAGLVAS
jgi:hypothetical protein